MSKVAEYEKSVWLKDIRSEKIKGKYYANDIRLFVVRKKNELLEHGHPESWLTVSDINNKVRGSVKKWMAERTATKKAENHLRGLDSTEEPFVPETTVDPKYGLEPPPVVYPQHYGDEAEWTFWKGRAVNLQEMLDESPADPIL